MSNTAEIQKCVCVVNVKVKVTLEQVTKAQNGSRVIALFFLELRR